MFFVSGITLSFFLSLLLVTKRQKKYADHLLSAWFFFAGVHQLLFYFDYTDFVSQHPFLAGVIIPFPLVHGPFLFLYVSARVAPVTPRRVALNLLHFVPFIACFLYLIPFFLRPDAERLYVMSHHGAGYETFVKIKLWIIIASGIVYISLSLQRLYQYQRKIVHHYSNLTEVDLQWLMYLAYGISSIWIVVILFPEVYTFYASVMFVALAGFFGLRHAGILSGNPYVRHLPPGFQDSAKEAADPDDTASKKTVRYIKSGLTAEKKAMIATDLTRRMVEQKPFLNPDLTLDGLAGEMQLNQNQLSQFINEELQLTFYDYINALRVKEFERLAALPESRKFTLLALAYNSGFNSKSTFNRYCKKITGKSPSAYLRSQKQA